MALSGEEAGVSGSGPASLGTGYSGHGVQLEEVEGKGHPTRVVGETLKLNEVRDSCADRASSAGRHLYHSSHNPPPPWASQVALVVKNPPVNAEDLKTGYAAKIVEFPSSVPELDEVLSRLLPWVQACDKSRLSFQTQG